MFSWLCFTQTLPFWMMNTFPITTNTSLLNLTQFLFYTFYLQTQKTWISIEFTAKTTICILNIWIIPVKLSREQWNLIFTFIHLLFKNEHKYIKVFFITIIHNRKHCNLKLQTYFLRPWTPFEIYFLVFNIFLIFKQTSTFCFHFQSTTLFLNNSWKKSFKTWAKVFRMFAKCHSLTGLAL